MFCVFSERRLICAGLFVILLGLGHRLVADDVECYGELNEIACPTLGPTGSCEDQGTEPGALIDCAINELEYHERIVGPYGCKTSPSQTYTKCKVETANGVAQTVACGQRYKCKIDSTGKICEKGGKYGSAYYADKHILDPAGCKQKGL